ncbi:MAG: hypothetical protein Q9160_001209 [Pyrenula sp. 1 TL-2023]
MDSNMNTPTGALAETIQNETSSGRSSRMSNHDCLFSSPEPVSLTPPSKVINLTIDMNDDKGDKATIPDEEEPLKSSETAQSRPVPASSKPPVPSRIADRVHPEPGIMDKRYLLAFGIGIEHATDLYIRYGVSYGERTAHYNTIISRRGGNWSERQTRAKTASTASSSAAKSEKDAGFKIGRTSSLNVASGRKRKEPNSDRTASSVVAQNSDEDAPQVASSAVKRQRTKPPIIVDSEDEGDGQKTVGGRRPASQCLKGLKQLDDTEHSGAEEEEGEDVSESSEAEQESADEETAEEEPSRKKRKAIDGDVVNDPSALDAELRPEKEPSKKRRTSTDYIPELERLAAPTMSSVRPSRGIRRSYRE